MARKSNRSNASDSDQDRIPNPFEMIMDALEEIRSLLVTLIDNMDDGDGDGDGDDGGDDNGDSDEDQNNGRRGRGKKSAGKSTKSTGGKGKKKKEPEPEEEEGDDDGDGDDEEITLDDLKELAAILLENGERETKNEILKKYKARSITKVAKKNYDAIYEDLYDAVEELELDD